MYASCGAVIYYHVVLSFLREQADVLNLRDYD